jgi:hypothetical protein
MRRVVFVGLLVVGSLVHGVPAEAQRKPARRPLGFYGFAEVTRQAFASSDTFDAIMRDTWGTFPGGGGQVRWWRLVFEVSASRYKRTGERAFVEDREVFRLGIPTTITMTPIEFFVAYRLPALWRVVPYAGGGAVRQSYKETSQFAQAGENVSDSHTGYHVTGGGEVRVWRWISTAVEARYRSVPGAIGKEGVSREFGEENLGGASVRVKLLVGR